MCGHDLIKLYTVTSAVDSILLVFKKLHPDCTASPGCSVAPGCIRLTTAVLLAALIAQKPISTVSESSQTALHRLQAQSADTLCSLRQSTVTWSIAANMLLSCCHQDRHVNVGMFCLAFTLVE